MIRAKRIQGLWAMAGGLTVLASQVGAIEPAKVLVYRAGPLVLRPQLDIAESYDDNVLYRPSNQSIGDFISLLSPGLNLELGRKEATYNFLFDYNYERFLYLRRDDLDHADHHISLKSKFEHRRLAVEGADRVDFLSGIIGGGNNVGQNVKRTIYSDRYRFEYALSLKTAVHLEGSFDAADYEKGTALYDYNSLRSTVGFGYRAFSKTVLFGELYYGQSATTPNFNAPKGPHLDFTGGFLGARGQFTPRLGGTLRAGYEVREFSGVPQTFGAPVVDASLDYQYSEKTSANLIYSRRTGVSEQAAGQSYSVDSAGLILNQKIGTRDKLVATFGANYYSTSYDIVGAALAREDQSFRVNFNLTYKIRLWLSTSLGYEFEMFSSNEPSIVDYEANRVTLRLLVGY